MMGEYEFSHDIMLFYCDNMSAIEISKYPVIHNRTKHIDILHHFIRALVEDKTIAIIRALVFNWLISLPNPLMFLLLSICEPSWVCVPFNS